MRALTIAATIALACMIAAPRARAQPAPSTSSLAQEPDRVMGYSDGAMGTDVHVLIWGDDEARSAAGAHAVFEEMKRLDRVMTTWKRDNLPPSEVVQINEAAGDHPVVVSDETYAVIARALDVSKRSGGVFDITVGAFIGLWKFDEEKDGSIPAPADVKARLKLVSWKDVVMDPAKHSVFLKRKGMAITLGGIAKGYAVDQCVKILVAQGFVDFIVQAGGDMYVSGRKGATPWHVAIRDPRGPSNSEFATAPISDHSFSTSGDYERGFVKDGVRYHHIIDPRTGFPAHASQSVTIRATDAFTADAWSKVMFIYGWKQGMEIIKREKLADFEAVWVDDKSEIHMTDDIKSVLAIEKQPTKGL